MNFLPEKEMEQILPEFFAQVSEFGIQIHLCEMNSPKHELGSVPVLRHKFCLGVDDFNKELQLPASSLIKFSTEARFIAFSKWPALAKMLQEDSLAIGLRTQIVRFSRPTLAQPGQVITVASSPYAIGATSLTIASEFFDEGEGPFAQVFSLFSRSLEKEPLQLPDYVGEELTWFSKQEDLQTSKDQAWLYKLLFARSEAIQPAMIENGHRVLVRKSDTGLNGLVSHHRLAEFFEDSLEKEGVPDLLVIDLLEDIFPRSNCEVRCALDSGNELIYMLVHADTKNVLARCYIHMQFKLIQNNL